MVLILENNLQNLLLEDLSTTWVKKTTKKKSKTNNTRTNVVNQSIRTVRCLYGKGKSRN